ncbi:MAG: Arginine--tRNA ligase [Methanobacteriota archaeon]|nr:MAG: Arginine--tRNA ligase [Euryarchaeota archaeon]
MKILKKIIEPTIEIIFKDYNLEFHDYKNLIQIPRDTDVCDLCIPCFSLSKILKKSPIQIAEEIASKAKKIIGEDISISSINGYVNFYSDPKWLIKKIILEKYEFFEDDPKSKILIEHTSANPNGPFHVGRARNAILGDALVRLNRDYGNSVQAEYYVDDMGKQVGILAWAIENLTKEEIEKALQREGIEELNPMWKNKEDHVRVRWYQAANILRKDNLKIESELNEMINKSEEGDTEVLNQFYNAFQPILDGMLETLSKLGIKYDSFTNESQFIIDGSVSKIMEELKSSELYGVAENGAKYLELESKGVSGKSTKFFYQRGDGSSLYATRDLAYHKWKWTKSDKLINVLGEDHRLQSKQVSIALNELKIKSPEVIFYAFIKLPEGKMSTRKGNVVFMDDLIYEAEELALEILSQRKMGIEKSQAMNIAKSVASSAIRFNILKVSPEKGFTFKWEDALSFDADSAPFIMYSHARSCSIKKKVDNLEYIENNIDLNNIELNDSISKLLRTIMRYEDSIEKSVKENKPNHFCSYMLELSAAYNAFYRDCTIINENEVNNLFFKVSEYSRKIINRGCTALGIIPLDSM